MHSVNTYTLYIVQCSDDTFYTGIAKDLDARIDLHNTGKGARYTRARRPVKLVYSEILENKSLALQREYEIKTWSRSRKLKLIQGQWNA